MAGIQLLRIECQILNGLREVLLVKLPFLRQRIQGRVHRVLSVDLKVPPQGGSRVAAPKAIGPERDVSPRHPETDLLGNEPHIVADGHEGAGQPFQVAFK